MPDAWARRASILPVRAAGVTFRASGHTLLDDVNLQLAPGTRTVVMGFNGAGKTLLLRILHGLLPPTSGTVTWSLDLPARALRARQAMVFQHPVMLRRTVAGNLRFAMSVSGMPRGARQARLQELLEVCDLRGIANRPARVLSGGQRQRVAVARALSTLPDILFLDEPTANLDPQSTRAVEALIQFAAESGTKVVLVTQHVGQALRLADDVVFVHAGRVTEHSPATAFFAQPESAPARAFLAGALPDA